MLSGFHHVLPRVVLLAPLAPRLCPLSLLPLFPAHCLFLLLSHSVLQSSGDFLRKVKSSVSVSTASHTTTTGHVSGAAQDQRRRVLVSCGMCPSVMPLLIEDSRVLIVLPFPGLFSQIVAENNFRPCSGREFQHKLHSMYRFFSSHALVALALI